VARYTWFFLIEVEALEGGDLLTPGSKALLQVCIPGLAIESTLDALDGFLTAERWRRLDLTHAQRYDCEKENGYPSGYLGKDLRHVAATGRPLISATFLSRESATYLSDPLN